MGDGTPSGKTNQYSELDRETSSDAALRGYAALGLTRKQDEHPPIAPDTDGKISHPYS